MGETLKIGQRVRITHKPERDQEFTMIERGARALHDGYEGSIRAVSNAHGECFEVQFLLGSAWYEPDELTPLDASDRAPHVKHESKIERAIGMFVADWNGLSQEQRDRVWGSLRWLVDVTNGVTREPPFGHALDASEPGDVEATEDERMRVRTLMREVLAPASGSIAFDERPIVRLLRAVECSDLASERQARIEAERRENEARADREHMREQHARRMQAVKVTLDVVREVEHPSGDPKQHLPLLLGADYRAFGDVPAEPATTADLDIWICADCGTARGEIHSPMCSVRSGKFKARSAEPPRAPLTEEEARQSLDKRADDVRRKVVLPRGGYLNRWDVTSDADREYWREVVRAADASRGDIPPEVRAPEKPANTPAPARDEPNVGAIQRSLEDLDRRLAALEVRRPRVAIVEGDGMHSAYTEHGDAVGSVTRSDDRAHWWVRRPFKAGVGDSCETVEQGIAKMREVLRTWADIVDEQPKATAFATCGALCPAWLEGAGKPCEERPGHGGTRESPHSVTTGETSGSMWLEGAQPDARTRLHDGDTGNKPARKPVEP